MDIDSGREIKIFKTQPTQQRRSSLFVKPKTAFGILETVVNDFDLNEKQMEKFVKDGIK